MDQFVKAIDNLIESAGSAKNHVLVKENALDSKAKKLDVKQEDLDKLSASLTKREEGI